MIHYIVGYLIMAYGLHYWIICIKLKAHYTKNQDPEVRKKYPPFVRSDVDKWHQLWTLPNIATAIPRLIIGFSLLMVYGIATYIVMIGVNADKIDKTRHTIIKIMGYFICRGILLVSGVIWLKTEYMEEVDYKKWLGPDWKPKWSGSGTLVANHING